MKTHSEMTFGCQVTAQARPPRQQRSFFVQNRNRFAGLRVCFPDLTSYTVVSGKAEPAEIVRFQRVFYVNCLIFSKTILCFSQRRICTADSINWNLSYSHHIDLAGIPFIP